MSYCRKTHTFFVASEGVPAINEEGKRYLYSPYAEFIYCFECDERLIEENPVGLNAFKKDRHGNVLCHEHEDYYEVCNECGAFFDDTNVITVGGQDITVCDECRNLRFFICSNCDEYHYNTENRYQTTNDTWICEECRNDAYIMCDHCNRYEHEDYIYNTVDGYNICENCHDNGVTQTCDRCDDIYYRHDNIRYYEDEEETLCDSCAEERGCFRSTTYNETINGYNFKPTPCFKKAENEETKEFFGFEIEVAGSRYHASGFLEHFKNNQLYLKSDSSIRFGGGFEIVTQPLSRRYFYEQFVPKLRDGLSFLQKEGFRGHNAGGIHIHVSNEAISPHQFKRIITLLYSKSKKSYKTWLAITQRHEGEMEQWAKIGAKWVSKLRKKDAFKIVDNYEHPSPRKKPDLLDNRYMGVNTKNSRTTEFRIFNSNIRISRIIKNAEVVFSLLDFAATNIMPTMNNYLLFVENNKDKYSYLFDFLLEKRIWTTKEQKVKIQETADKLGCRNAEELRNYINSLNIETNLTVDDNDERITTCA